MLPHVAVVVPAFRRPALLAQAVRSALSQEGVAVDLYVVDDDPAQSGARVAKELRDPRVRYLAMPEPSGGRVGRVRNHGLGLAAAPFVHFLDDDDRVPPGAYAALCAALRRHPGCAFAFGTVAPAGDDPVALERERLYFQAAAHRLRLVSGLRGTLVSALLFQPAPLVCSAAIFRREALLALGGFDPSLRLCEDVDLFVRAARRFGARFVDRPALLYRVGGPSLAHARGARPIVRRAYLRIQRAYRRAHGAAETLALKVFARAVLTFA